VARVDFAQVASANVIHHYVFQTIPNEP